MTTGRSARLRRHLLVILVDARTGSAHLVRTEAIIAGRRTGRYLALCDTVVLAASLTAPEQTYCRSCARVTR